METIITLKQISKCYYGQTILSPFDFTVLQGQSIAFTGHNGTGKSTLLKLIAKLITPTSGEVKYHKKLSVSYIPEHFPKMSLTALQYLESMSRIDGMGRQEFEDISQALFQDFFIQDMVCIPMKHLSKGTLQKVGVIQALLKTPDVLLLDEPLSGQDQESQSVFIAKMNQLRSKGVTLLMSCHETFLVNRISDTVYQIQGGSVSKVQADCGQMEEKYTLIFRKAPSSRMPDSLKLSLTPVGEQYKLTVPESESRSTILLMLEHGWDLKGMYYENNL